MALVGEVGKYIVSHYATVDYAYRAYISLYGTDGTTHLGAARFFNDPSDITSPFVLSGGKVYLHYRAEDFPQVIDLLRNEKPLYLHHWTTVAGFRSSKEPVGEGEPE